MIPMIPIQRQRQKLMIHSSLAASMPLIGNLIPSEGSILIVEALRGVDN